MGRVATNEFRGGVKVLIDNDPYAIIENEMVKPGKGQAFSRVKLRNLKTGRVLDRTFKSGETLPLADVVELDMSFLYSDDEFWHFMVPDTYEQHAAGEAVMAEAKLWLTEGVMCTITMFNGSPLLVMPPNFIEAVITETDPGVRGDTVSGGSKPATLETGAVVQVPLFVDQGEVIKVDTRKKSYVSRVRK